MTQVFDLPGTEILSLAKTEQGFEIEAATFAAMGQCPSCGRASTQIHSRYTRHPRDLPCQGIRVKLSLHVKRFFCRNPNCPRHTFAESVSELVAKYARRTRRFTEHLEAIVFATGGESGTRLSSKLGLSTSPATLLRVIDQTVLPVPPATRVLGVDDWAFRKGQRYGTVLCDLERHAVVDILPDREAESLKQWLLTHPEVEIISRDRAAAYSDGATRGAPQAQQVADRWHLLKNLRETVQTILEHHRNLLTVKETDQQSQPESEKQRPQAIGNPHKPLSKKAEASLINREKLLVRYQQVSALSEKSLSIQHISQQVGLSEETVKRYIEAEGFPEIKRYHRVSTRALAPYQSYLNQRWDEGCHNATQLWYEIKAQGFTRSLAMVRKYVAQLRQGSSVDAAATECRQHHSIRRYTPRQVAWFITTDHDSLEPVEQQDLQRMRQQSTEIEQAYQLAKSFITLFRERQPDQLAHWLSQAFAASQVWQTFATGLYKDQSAVHAALSLEWSNGQVEGQVNNRIKTIKRQMYGRAGFALLRKHILYRIT